MTTSEINSGTFEESMSEVFRTFTEGKYVDLDEAAELLSKVESAIGNVAFVCGILPQRSDLDKVDLLRYIAVGPPKSIVLGEN